jgi:hypothetical protein
MKVYRSTENSGIPGHKPNMVFAGPDSMNNDQYIILDGAFFAIDPREYEVVQVSELPKHYKNNKFYLIDGVFSYINAEDEVADKWVDVRAKRDQLLDESDELSLSKWQDRWLAQSEALRNAWTAYRQALRDIPTTYTNPDEVVWPDLPA